MRNECVWCVTLAGVQMPAQWVKGWPCVLWGCLEDRRGVGRHCGLQGTVSFPDPDVHFSSFTCIPRPQDRVGAMYIFNLIVGAGALALPLAFSKSGVIGGERDGGGGNRTKRATWWLQVCLLAPPRHPSGIRDGSHRLVGLPLLLDCHLYGGYRAAYAPLATRAGGCSFLQREPGPAVN